MDVLDYMLPDSVFAESNHLAIAGGGQPTYTKVIGNQIWYMKNAKGYPWDMNTFDDDFVYQSITEINWEDPETFKIFSSKSWAGANGGIVWCEREIDRGIAGLGVVTIDSSYRYYTDCDHYTEHDLGGPILSDYVFETKDFGGDLGIREALVVRYRWGQNLANLEVDSYVRGYGWVQWELWNLVDGVYTPKQVSAFNTFVEGGSPDPVFPCGVPKIG